MDFNSLLKQAQKIQEDMERQDAALKEKEYTSKTLKNIVQIIMNGEYQITSVKLDDDFVKSFTSDDKEILEDAISVAVNELTEEITADKEGMFGNIVNNPIPQDVPLGEGTQVRYLRLTPVETVPEGSYGIAALEAL